MIIKNQLRKDVARLPVMVLLALGCFQLASFQFASVTQAAESSSSGGTESASNWAQFKGKADEMTRFLDASSGIVNKAGNNLSNEMAMDDVLRRFGNSLYDLDHFRRGSDEYNAAAAKSFQLYQEYSALTSKLRKHFDETFAKAHVPSQFLSVSPKSIEGLKQGWQESLPQDWLRTRGVDDLFKMIRPPVLTEVDFEDPSKIRAQFKGITHEHFLAKRRQLVAVIEVLRKADQDGLRLALDGGPGRTNFAKYEDSRENRKLAALREQFDNARKRLPEGRIGNRFAVFSVGVAGALLTSFANAGEAKPLFNDEEPTDRSTANDAGWARSKPAKGISK